jgi:hypothetical protein
MFLLSYGSPYLYQPESGLALLPLLLAKQLHALEGVPEGRSPVSFNREANICRYSSDRCWCSRTQPDTTVFSLRSIFSAPSSVAAFTLSSVRSLWSRLITRTGLFCCMIRSSTYKRARVHENESCREEKESFCWGDSFCLSFARLLVEEQKTSMRAEQVREIENAIATPGNRRSNSRRGQAVGLRLRRIRLKAIARRRSCARFYRVELSMPPVGILAQPPDCL